MDYSCSLIYYSSGPYARAYLRAEAPGKPAAHAALSAQRLRAAISPPPGTPALLQRPLPGGGTEVVAVESPGEIPGHQHYAVSVVEAKMAGVPVGIVTPKNGIDPRHEHRVLINLHGGGFTMGRGLVAGKGESIPVAAAGRIKVVTVDYRMVPYASYPSASEDVEAVYRGLLKTYKPGEIGIFGCSAGGILTSQSVVWLQSKGLPRPGAVGIFCAAPVPPSFRGDSAVWDGAGIFQPPPDVPGSAETSSSVGHATVPASAMDYFKAAKMDDPRAVPIASDEALAKFPPTLWITGTRSFDMSPVIVCHARFLKLGVDSYLYVMEGGQHGAYNIGEHMTLEGARYSRVHRPVVPTASFAMNAARVPTREESGHAAKEV